MQTEKKRLLIREILGTKTPSFHYSDKPTYPLASGKLSKYYIDCKVALSHANIRGLVGEIILDMLGHIQINAVGGLIIGAYPVAIAVSDAAAKRGINISAFVVRKDPKPHGLRKYIEGDVEKGQRVLIVDDVVTTGESTFLAIRRCKEEGLEVVKAIALVDRQEQEGRENIEKTGVKFDSILTLKDLQTTNKSQSSTPS